MSSVPEGYYEGKIVAAEMVEGYEGKGVAISFDVEIADGTEIVTCTHAVVGMTWPDCIADLTPAIGKPCRVLAKLNQRGTKMNYYITTARAKKPASEDAVRAEIAKLKSLDDEDNIPF